MKLMLENAGLPKTQYRKESFLVRHLVSVVILAALLVAPGLSFAQTGESHVYKDGSHGTVILPLGDLSFADVMVSYHRGKGMVRKSARHPEYALGPADYIQSPDTSFVTLGCGGTLVLKFTDNELTDIKGPDLYVFEIGPMVEGMSVGISKSGKDWIDLGAIGGGVAEVDISKAVKPGETFRFVRLSDDGVDCGGEWAGADIDAVAAIGSVSRFVLKGGVMFAYNSAELQPEAKAALDKLAGKIAAAGFKSLSVVGYTDSRGSDSYNLALSKARATSVRDYLAGLDILKGVTITAEGRGEASPVASNATEKGRRQNRRVEIIGR